MRTVKYLLAGAVIGGSSAWGGPLEKKMISDEAKWVAHLDLEAFQESEMGGYLLGLAKKAIDEENNTPIKVDIDLVLQEVKSFTAYGFEFQDHPEENSVLVMQTGERMRAMIDALLATMELSGEGDSDFQILEGKPFPTYFLGKELYISVITDTLFIGSKSFEQIERAFSVIDGKAGNLEKGDSDLVRNITDEFFLFASADGLNKIDGIPPQARMLQQATGAQFALGEADGDIRSRLLLTTESKSVSDQLYRIIQGMLALVSFAQVENESIAEIVKNARVDHGSDFVSVDLKYPIERIMTIARALLEEDAKASTRSSSSKKKKTNSVNVVVGDSVGGQELTVINADAKSDNGNLPRRSVDGNLDTHWGSKGRGQWIRFELASPSLVRELEIAWRRGDERRHRFTVQRSSNGVDWKNVIDRMSSGTTDGFESFNIPDTATGWIRIWCNANTKDPMNTISEIRFLGDADYEISVEGADDAE